MIPQHTHTHTHESNTIHISANRMKKVLEGVAEKKQLEESEKWGKWEGGLDGHW